MNSQVTSVVDSALALRQEVWTKQRDEALEKQYASDLARDATEQTAREAKFKELGFRVALPTDDTLVAHLRFNETKVATGRWMSLLLLLQFAVCSLLNDAMAFVWFCVVIMTGAKDSSGKKNNGTFGRESSDNDFVAAGNQPPSLLLRLLFAVR